MRIGRTLAPAAAPIGWGALLGAAAGILFEDDPAELDAEVRRAMGVDHAWFVSSGTAALALALAAVKAGRRETDVIIPAYTCFSVPAAVMHAGGRPVPCEIDPRTFDYEPASLAAAIGPNTLAIVAHDLFGMPADIARIRVACQGRDIAIVEDAAQAFGVRWRGESLGIRGDAGIFSFGRGKHLTCGAGGMIVTSSPRIAAALDAAHRRLTGSTRTQMMREWVAAVTMAVFIRPSLFWIPASLPFLRLGETIFPDHLEVGRLSNVHRALLTGWGGRLAALNQARARVAAELAERLSVELPCGPRHPYLRLPVLADSSAERAGWLSRSRARGLGLGAGYPSPVGEIPEVRAAIGPTRFPQAADVAARLVTIPTHQWVTARDIEAIVDCLRHAGTTRHYELGHDVH